MTVGRRGEWGCFGRPGFWAFGVPSLGCLLLAWVLCCPASSGLCLALAGFLCVVAMIAHGRLLVGWVLLVGWGSKTKTLLIEFADGV